MSDRESLLTENRPPHPAHGSRAVLVLSCLFLFLQPMAGSSQQRPTVERTGRTAGEGPLVIRQRPVRAELAPELLQVKERPPIEFVPFPMVDPHTLQPIAPEASIELPDGRTVTAAQFYQEANSFEAYLNAHGYSLRQPGFSIDLIQVPRDDRLLREQLRSAPGPTRLRRRVDFLKEHSFRALSEPRRLSVTPREVAALRIPTRLSQARLQDAVERLNAAQVSATRYEGLVVDPEALGRLAALDLGTGSRGVPPPARPIGPPPSCTPVGKSQSWSWLLGDPAKFDAYVNGMLQLTGEACEPPPGHPFDQNSSKFSLTAEGKSGGHVFGVGGDVLRFSGSMGGDQTTKSVSANVGVFVLGQTVYSLSKSEQGHWGIDDSVSKGVDFSATFPIPVGPFTIDVTAGAQGSVGFGYSVSLYPIHVSAAADPFVHTSVYLEAGLNAFVAKAGVGANMTLLDADLHLGAGTGIGFLLGFYTDQRLYGEAALDMLSGSCYVFAKVYYPCFDPWPDICSKKWTANLWSWDGFQYNSVLFDERTISPLSWYQ